MVRISMGVKSMVMRARSYAPQIATFFQVKRSLLPQSCTTSKHTTAHHQASRECIYVIRYTGMHDSISHQNLSAVSRYDGYKLFHPQSPATAISGTFKVGGVNESGVSSSSSNNSKRGKHSSRGGGPPPGALDGT